MKKINDVNQYCFTVYSTFTIIVIFWQSIHCLNMISGGSCGLYGKRTRKLGLFCRFASGLGLPYPYYAMSWLKSPLSDIVLFQPIVPGAICSGRGGPQEFPPFFFKKNLREGSLAEPQKSGWWYGKTAHQKSCLADFWFCPPPPSTPIWFTTEIVVTMGGYLTPCIMDWQIIAMLEHHKSLGWCSHIARIFVSASPTEISDAWAQKPHFYTLTMMNLAVDQCASPS